MWEYIKWILGFMIIGGLIAFIFGGNFKEGAMTGGKIGCYILLFGVVIAVVLCLIFGGGLLAALGGVFG